MDPAARRRACVKLRVKLSRDTGTNLTAAACEGLLDNSFGLEGKSVSLQSDPGLFYACLGEAIEDQALVVPNRDKVAWWCFREAAEVHKHPVGMRKLFGCLHHGRGATADPAQAALWLQKAADLGNPGSKAVLGATLAKDDAHAEVASCGFELLREAVAQGYSPALYHVLLEGRGCREGRCTRSGPSTAGDHAHSRGGGGSDGPVFTRAVLHGWERRGG